MADNYLENQYEQYQARKAAWEKERKYGKKSAGSNSKMKQVPPVEVLDKQPATVSSQKPSTSE